MPGGTLLLQRLRRHQGGGGAMFWAGIVGRDLVGSFRVPVGVKLSSQTYTDCLQQNLIQWCKKKRVAFKRKPLFIHDNAACHSTKSTVQYLEKVVFTQNKMIPIGQFALRILTRVRTFGKFSNVACTSRNNNFRQRITSGQKMRF